MAGRAEGHGRDTPGICQVCARHIGGDPERAVGLDPLLAVIEVLTGHQDRSAPRLDYLRKGKYGAMGRVRGGTQPIAPYHAINYSAEVNL